MTTPSLAGSKAPRLEEPSYEQVLEPLFRRAVERGERVAFTARAVASLLVGGQLLVFRLSDSAGLRPQDALVLTVLFAGAIAPLVVARGLAGRLSTQTRAVGSVFLDACTVFLALVPMVVTPYEDYAGLLREPEPGFFVLATMFSALRLSRQAVTVSFGANLFALVSLVMLDLSRNGELIRYGAYNIGIAGALIAGAGLGAWLWASRTRALVYSGSRATMLAERAQKRFGIYVSEEVAEQALGDEQPELGGQLARVAVLFSDLRGFTSWSEGLTPQELVVQLNAYLEDMVREIRAEGGIVDKYIGDAIMAVFGLKEPEDAAARALRAADRMDGALSRHNEARAARGLSPLRHGIGVHTGEVVAGNIGTRDRMQFTVVGDVVNLAARLEAATKERGTSLIASEAAIAAARAAMGAALPTLIDDGALAVRGQREPVRIFKKPSVP